MEDKIVSPYDLVSKEHCETNTNKMLEKMGQLPVILEKIENINKHFDKEGMVSKIESHVEKTNGRVRKLETWRSFLLGGWAVISILFPILFVFFMSNFRYEVREIISNQVTTAINDYDESIFEEIK